MSNVMAGVGTVGVSTAVCRQMTVKYLLPESRPVRTVPAAAARPVISVASAEAGQLVYTPLPAAARGGHMGCVTLLSISGAGLYKYWVPPLPPPPHKSDNILFEEFYMMVD